MKRKKKKNNNNKIGSKTRFFYNMDFSFKKKATAEAENDGLTITFHCFNSADTIDDVHK